jgi:hypothetical protein
MTRRTRLAVTVLLTAMLPLTAGCGVGTEEEPQPMETTTLPQPPVLPSVDVEPSRTTSPASPAASSTGPSAPS